MPRQRPEGAGAAAPQPPEPVGTIDDASPTAPGPAEVEAGGAAAHTPPGDDLAARTLSGLGWSYLALAATVLIQIVYSAFMGRLLDPVAFGLVAVAGIVLQFSFYFSDMGVGQALMQRRTLSEDDVRVGFTTSVLFGIVVYAAVWGAAPLIERLFPDAPGVAGIVRVLALSLLIGGFSVTAQNLLKRELRFQAVAAINVAAFAVGYLAVGLTSAFLGLGVWSLVAATVTFSAVTGVLSYACSRHAVRPLLRWSIVRSLYSYGARVSVINFLEYLGNNLDTAAVGRYAGAAPTGQYSRAFMLMNLPIYYAGDTLIKVLFPSMSRIQDDLPRLRRAFVSVAGAAAALLLPLATGLAVASQEFVRVLIGDQWGPAAEILPIIAVAASVNLLSTFAGSLIEVRADLNRKLAFQAAYLVVLAALMWQAVGRGLWAYAAALAVAEVLRHVGYLVLLRRAIGLRAGDILRPYGAAALAAALVGLLVAGARILTVDHLNVLAVFLLEAVAGAFGLWLAVRFGPLRRLRTELADRLRGGLGGSLPPRVQRLLRVALGVR